MRSQIPYFPHPLPHFQLDILPRASYLATKLDVNHYRIISMRFSDWMSFEDAVETVTEQPGLFQVKIRDGLFNYPTGQSAMFYYGYADNLFQGIANFLEQILPALDVDEHDLFVRTMPTETAESKFKQHLNFFHSNFGSLPYGNELLLKKMQETASSNY